MQITITARHFNLTKSLRSHVESVVLKLDKFFNHIIDVDFILNVEGKRDLAEMTLHASHFTLHSEAEGEDMYKAIDSVVDKMETQLKKKKEKITKHSRRVAAKAKDNYFIYADKIKKDEPSYTVKSKKIFAPSVTIDTAISNLKRAKGTYYVFRNLETDKINVLIEKDSEHYKLIEP